jgi:small subunit ribosomal protein S20
VANTKSAIKRIRSSERKRQRNRVYRTRARTYIKRTRALISEGRLEEARAAAELAASTLDRAAVKGVIHENNAARRKSRLMRMLVAAEQKPAD